jgi:nucleobase:cation symporter-1, NCS1 family
MTPKEVNGHGAMKVYIGRSLPILQEAVLLTEHEKDLLPTPPEKRSWTYLTYTFLYFSWSMDNWTLGSTMIGIGLNWWQSILVIFGSQMISSIFQALNSRSGAVYHVGYPIVSRSVFGMYGAYYVVFARAVLAVVYYAIKRKYPITKP